jgi:hypothetical protein
LQRFSGAGQPGEPSGATRCVIVPAASFRHLVKTGGLPFEVTAALRADALWRRTRTVGDSTPDFSGGGDEVTPFPLPTIRPFKAPENRFADGAEFVSGGYTIRLTAAEILAVLTPPTVNPYSAPLA